LNFKQVLGDIKDNRQLNNLSTLSDFYSGYRKSSKDFSYETTQPWLAGTSGTMTWENNAGEFSTGDYFCKIDQIGGYAQNIRVPIPEEKRIVGETLRVAVKYKSPYSPSVVLYLRDSTTWVNNAGAVLNRLPISVNENIFYIERPYEAGAVEVVFYLSSTFPGTGIVKFGQTQLLTKDKDFFGIFNPSLYTKKATSFNNTIIVDSLGGGDFTSIRAALKSITNAGEQNTYLLKVKNGTYNEIDIVGSNYTGNNLNVVVLEGESKEGVIIRTDGTSTAISPSDYSRATYQSVAINTIPQDWKHTFWLVKTMTVRNITILANDVKYCNHQDAEGSYDSLFENCHIIKQEENVDASKYFVIGIGSRVGQYQRYKKCTIELRYGFNNAYSAAGIFWHNWGNQTGATGMEVTDCHFINCHYLYASDLGSGQNDIIKINGCSLSKKDKGILYYLTEGYYTPTPATPSDYPYNINLQINNSDVNYFELESDRAGAGEKAIAHNEYHIKVKNKTGSTISKGTAVKIDWADLEVSSQIINKATDNIYDFVVWQDILTNSEGYAVPKNKTVECLAIAGTYSNGDKVKINANGIFEKTLVESEKIGVVAKSEILGSTALLRIYLVI